MTDHPILVPTSEGPVGGIVSEPAGKARAKLILLPGYGRPARSGTNSFWTRTARALAELGMVTLRFDYSREGETLPLGAGRGGMAWKSELDMQLLREVSAWFSAQTGDLPLFLTGACAGTRFALRLAADDPRAVAGVFSIVLDTRSVDDDVPSGSGLGDPDEIDPPLVEELRAVLEHAPSWVVIGERDHPDIPRLKRLLGSTRHELELEIVPGAALHFLDQPDIQEQAGSRLLARIAAALSQPLPPPGATS